MQNAVPVAPRRWRVSRGRAVRTALALLYLGVVFGIFAQRQFFADSSSGGRSTSTEAQQGPALGTLDDRTFAIGEPAPDFALTTKDGSVVRLSDLRGKSVVLNFWASWCGPCREEMPEFEEAHRARADRGDLVIVAVNELADDSRGAADAFVDALGVTFPVAYDTDTSAVGRRYGVRGLPSTFFIDGEGIVRAATLGPVFGELLPRGIDAADTSTTLLPP